MIALLLSVAVAALGQDGQGTQEFLALFRPLEGGAGVPDTAQCDVTAVEMANTRQLEGILEDLAGTRFFSLFRVDLTRECQFWGKDGGGSCDGGKKKDGPAFLAGGGRLGPAKSSKLKQAADDGATPSCALSADGSLPFTPTSDPVDKAGVSGALPDVVDNCEVPEFWLDMCEDIPTSNVQYVNLQTNPERYTGFNGSKIWDAIYQENCFSRTDALDDMCYEERVLYRMLSGMHSSINIHIALHWYPPRKGKRTHFAPNPSRFSALFKEHPERIKNVHFAFVVLLRAVKKATPFLLQYNVSAGDPDEDLRTTRLLHRLTDAHIMKSCSGVFEAFDESRLFGSAEQPLAIDSLKHSFKGVFRNISRVLDCVTCQTCKLHGKMQLLGMGAALKILLMPDTMVSNALSRDEVVALINTVHKFSHAITGARNLFQLDIDNFFNPPLAAPAPPTPVLSGAAPVHAAPTPAPTPAPTNMQLQNQPAPLPPLQTVELADSAVGLVARLAVAGLVTPAQETELVSRALRGDATLLIFAKHYGADPAKFLRFALAFPEGFDKTAADVALATAPAAEKPVDAVIVGAGLAGLTAALTMVDRGGRVILLDKNKFTGGNSAYASSGINAIDPSGPVEGDSFDEFFIDTARSSGTNVTSTEDSLISVLTGQSGRALQWIRERVGLELSKRAQLGGHSFARTYRPSTGMAGSEMVFAATKLVKELAKGPLLDTMFGTTLKELVLGPDGTIAGVRVETADAAGSTVIRAPAVVLATGGYSSDDGTDSLLAKFRPDTMRYATTNGAFATGDGHKVAMAAGAECVNLDHVQVHPTAFVDRKHPNATRLTLAAELLRGVGGLLLDRAGRRFADELGKRDYVTGRMIEEQPDKPHYTLLLTEAHAEIANKHVPHYLKKGLLTKLGSLAEVAAWMTVPEARLKESLAEYEAAAAAGVPDTTGKQYFNNPSFLNATTFYAGTVTPARHYSMGGIKIDVNGRVLGANGVAIPGLYAAGEVTGGVHGVNRLGGNALTECIVFGQLVGESLPIAGGGGNGAAAAAGAADAGAANAGATGELPKVTAAELAAHSTDADCWIAVYGKVYNFDEFAAEHPGGIESLLKECGVEATEIFDSIHSRAMLDDFEVIGLHGEAS